MKNIIILFITFLCFNSFAKSPSPAKLKHDITFILARALDYKHLNNNSQIALPIIYLKSTTPLKKFQDAIESQWGQRPSQFTNAYSVANNEIYLLDDADYYIKTGRCIDDSLAHELTHFIQVKYQKFDINDESLEWDAIDLQTWFRETYCK